MINKFLNKFGIKIDFLKKGKRYYLADDALISLDSKINLDSKLIGLFLGEEKKTFEPSLAFLELVSKGSSDKKIFIDANSEWLFLCGRDIFGKSIVKANISTGFVLVQNSKDENLGLGKFTADLKLKDKVVVRNIIDRGDFLRRES
jgi:ribosome biogenesis protein Nip4